MAGYRQFLTKFWKDPWISELPPLEKLLFSYLFTNEQSSISGIYEITIKTIAGETDLDKDFILAAFAKFQAKEKIFYQDGVMWVVNMRRHHKNASPHTMARVNNDIDQIPDGAVKTAYIYYQKTGKYCIDTVSIQITESVRENVIKSVRESVSETTPADAFVSKLDTVIGVPFGGNSDADTAVEMIREYGLERVDRAARWVREKKFTTMKTALRSMNTALSNGGFQTEKATGNGHKRILHDADGNEIEMEA